MKTNFKLTCLSLAILQSFYSQSLLANEQNQTEANKDVEVIQVKGFGASLGKALREKRFADSVVEVVSSDDLGVLPDVSITDSLVRLPGIAASRDRGNASRISIRGMGPRLNAATMNNREIVSAEPSRDVRFEQFPAELIDSVEVYKSPTANIAEGGISGLVNMNFVSPLSKDKRLIAINGNLMKNSLGSDLPGTDGNGHKASFSYVDKLSDTFGFAIGLTYQDQPSLERGVQSWDYNNADNRGDLNENGIVEDAPWGVVAKSKRGTNERTGGLVILEWQPTDSFTLKSDLFYSQFDIKERDDQMGPGDLGNWADDGSGPRGWGAGAYDSSSVTPTFITKTDGSEQLVAGSQFNNGLSVATPTWFQTNEMLSAGLNGVYIGDTWTMSADIGYSEASIESVWARINPLYIGGDYDLGFNINNTDAAQIILHSGDISSPENYTLGAESEVWYEADDGSWYAVNEYSAATMDGIGDKVLSDEMVNLNLDFERDVDWGIFSELTFGGRYTDRTKTNDQINDWSRTAIQDHGLTDYGISYGIGGNYVVPDIYTYGDWDEVAKTAFGGATNPAPNRNNKNVLASWELQEANTAFYTMLNISGDIGNVDFTGNVGLRYAKTEVTSIGHESQSAGWVEDANGNWYEDISVTPTTVHHNYAQWLPSLNLTFHITDDSQIRFALARTMARPPLLEMRTGFSLNKTSQPYTAEGGNPTLDPYIANQLDFGYEYFWGDNSAATINFFFKDLESHIGLLSDTVTFDGTRYAFTGTVNGDGGTIKGVELLYQQKLDMLPAPFDGLGIFANYSYTDSEVMEFKPVNNPYNLGGLSKNIASATLWYDKNGFDARVSYNYRSEFTGINSWTPSQVNLNAAETTVDASIGYQVTDNLKLTLQGQNLTNAASVNYWDNDMTKPAFNVEWGRRYLIGFQLTL
ncbi:TonB-dependent receptor [Paraglaciecola aquimarina]|uniref:TonB-dependent receptor n=1 Tax=Paraglaciecola algarum TaxID=3050085 RepID=A0ABS9D9M4_9ALTE|nr:TonB-dependent receptor [Paraglaciecola sp. G1-23]MCF2949581.1 TonB-dependent receptor [Paraglaciecola sp. G1-23]